MKKFVAALLVGFCCLTAGLVAQTGATGRATPAAAGAAAAQGGAVTIANFQFTPATITVKAGSTVTWTNKEGAHTVTADDGSWESPTLKAGQTFSRKFDRPGTHRYYCSFHGGKGGHDMSGVVRVVR